MHKGRRTLIQLLLLQLHTLILLRKFVLYTLPSRVGVSATPPTVFKNDLKLAAK